MKDGPGATERWERSSGRTQVVFVLPRCSGWAAGASHDSPNSKRAHFRAPTVRTPPKLHERTPRERRKKRQLWWERGKKREIVGSPPFGPPRFGSPTLRGPTLSRFGPPPSQSHLLWSKNSTSKNWPKSKLAEVETGRSLNWPKSKLAELENNGRSRNWQSTKLCSRRDVPRNASPDQAG